MAIKRLIRKESDKKLSGLCAGIAEYLDVDATVVRLIVLILTVMSGVIPGLLTYLVATAITPKEGEVK